MRVTKASAGHELGLAVHYDGQALRIVRINAGLIADWNTNMPDVQVRAARVHAELHAQDRLLRQALQVAMALVAGELSAMAR